MYLNYAKEHWTLPDENPPIGLVLCAEKGAGEAYYALAGLLTPFWRANIRCNYLMKNDSRMNSFEHRRC